MCITHTKYEREELSPTTVFELLSHQLRCELLRGLHEYNEPLALADAADELAVATNDVRSLADVDPEEVKRIYMALYPRISLN